MAGDSLGPHPAVRGRCPCSLASPLRPSPAPAPDGGLALVPQRPLSCVTQGKPRHLSGLQGPCLEGRDNVPGPLGGSNETPAHRTAGGQYRHLGHIYSVSRPLPGSFQQLRVLVPKELHWLVWPAYTGQNGTCVSSEVPERGAPRSLHKGLAPEVTCPSGEKGPSRKREQPKQRLSGRKVQGNSDPA